ncbi:hypothetical protein WJX75_008345 [Coccomyxa subellipsoidea]|uniref:Uncharacterized protein n=1 Tax=Coccomyxa subellipsoidea TaxID=248742 RepID=A0ABR2YQA4_9CHLO
MVATTKIFPCQEISASMAEAGEPKTKLAIPAEPSLEATEELAEELAEEPLLAHETLPLELPGDLGTTPLQGEGGRPTQGTPSLMTSLPSPGPGLRQPAGTPAGTPTLPSSSAVASGGLRSFPGTPNMPHGPPGQMTTPGASGASGKWRGGSVRASPMSATTPGPRVPQQDPAIFTVTDRKVRIREHEKGTPLYVMCRKWVQNEPDTDLMPPKDRAEEAAAREREAATIKLPPVPQLTAEEEAQAEQPPEAEPPLPQPEKERPSIEMLKRHHQDHWLGGGQNLNLRGFCCGAQSSYSWA